jgi:hypothetical protein
MERGGGNVMITCTTEDVGGARTRVWSQRE